MHVLIVPPASRGGTVSWPSGVLRGLDHELGAFPVMLYPLPKLDPGWSLTPSPYPLLGPSGVTSRAVKPGRERVVGAEM